MNLPDLLVKLLIAVLAFWLGEKVIGLVKNAEMAQILTVILVVAVVLWILFGSLFLPLR